MCAISTNDNDGFGDFDEDAAGSDPLNPDSTPEGTAFGFPGFNCSDGLDNDLDGLVDADDPGCDQDGAYGLGAHWASARNSSTNRLNVSGCSK